MISCRVWHTEDYLNRESKNAWNQSFARVPCAGELLEFDGNLIEVRQVVWKEEGPELIVHWDGRTEP